MKLTTIKPYPKNAKQHPKKQIEQIAASIKEFGFNQKIVVDKDNVIIVGHGRYEAAKLLGLEDVPVEKVNLNEQQAKAYRLADNKLNESDWDMDLAIGELKGLSSEMFELTGFDKDLLIEPDEKDDEVPDVPDEPRSKLGEIYQLGRHRVMCGDATKKEDVDKLMDGKKADMVFTDPPYFIQGSSTGLEVSDADSKMVEPFFNLFLESIHQNTKWASHLYVCCDWRTYPFIRRITDRLFKNKNLIVWNKGNPTMGVSYRQQYELVAFFSNSKKANSQTGFIGDGKVKKAKYEVKFKERPLNDLSLSNVWDIARVGGKREHFAEKPNELIKRAVQNSSNVDDIILDPFLGSGSTLIACEKTHRICYGMEIDPRYVDVIIDRYEQYSEEKAEKIG